MNEIEFTGENNPLLKEKTKLWSANTTDGAEIETSNFIYSLIRLLKPKVVVETGCYKGDTTELIQKALDDNGYGELYSCDIDEALVKEVQKRVKKANISKKTGVELIRELGGNIEFAFIDSGYKARGEEIDELLKHLSEHQMFALHDTAPQHTEMNKLSEGYNLRKVYFNTPRGLTLYEK